MRSSSSCRPRTARWPKARSPATTTPGAGYKTGRNSYLQASWLPPDPPPGHGVHRYAFQLFALDGSAAAFSETPGRDEVLEALRDHAIASGCLIGTYERPDGSIPERETEAAPAFAPPSALA